MSRPIDESVLVQALMKYKCTEEVVNDKKSYEAVYDVCDFVYETIKSAPTLTLNTLRDEIFQDAMKKGLFEEFDRIKDPVRKRRKLAIRIMEEAAEMYAAADDPKHYAEEAADVTLMTGDVCAYLGIDWHGAVMAKKEFNKTRPWKHGKE